MLLLVMSHAESALRMHARPVRVPALLGPLSALGAVLGALAFAAALTPSLIPREGALQGGLAGAAFALVYGIGVTGRALWTWLGLPLARRPLLIRLGWGLAMLIALVALSRATGWQNAVMQAAGLPPVETARPMIIGAVAALTAFGLIGLARIFDAIAHAGAVRLARRVPPRMALLVSLGLTAWLFWSIGNGVFARGLVRALDTSYAQIDALLPPDLAAPSGPLQTGSPESLIAWEGIGARGRTHVLAEPGAETITALAGRAAQAPLRVYVGVNSAEDAEARAALALAELIRIEAFDRAHLVIATPTGTGWIDRASLSGLEFLTLGDMASVSVQYSYLPSWLSLLTEPDFGRDTAQAVFAAVYGHWRGLPAGERPRLWLHGLSLGAYNSELSFDEWQLLADPFDGAFWVGPPFAAPRWRRFTDLRAPASPAWAPVFGDGSLVRFATAAGLADHRATPWGPLRILYLQYPSDAITFFEPAMIWRKPDWLAGPRAPDVPRTLRWVPVVTFLQVLVDLLTATTPPKGHGHVYAARDYLDGWLALVEPEGWDADALARLRLWYAARGL